MHDLRTLHTSFDRYFFEVFSRWCKFSAVGPPIAIAGSWMLCHAT